jgi:hypothetical protein
MTLGNLSENRELCETTEKQRLRIGGCSSRLGGRVVVIDEPAHDCGGDDVSNIFAFFKRLSAKHMCQGEYRRQL